MTTTLRSTDRLDLTDADAFGRWYDAHWDAAVTRARHLTRDRALAEDIAAEALFRVWKRWQTSGTPERPWPYLVTTIHNVAVNHFRRHQLEQEHLAQVDPVPAPSVEDRVIDRQTVLELVPRLPGQERASVVLHYLADVPSREVADRLAIRPVTVRSHLHRARRRLATSDAA